MIKQIVLQLDSQRYLVLTEALKLYASHENTTEKCGIIAEQLDGLVTTQWTGSREEIKSNIMPVHEYVPDVGSEVCIRCGLSSRHNIHNLEVSLEQVAKIATKFDKITAGEKQPMNYHRFEPSTKLDGTPDYKRCAICHKGQRARVHSLDE
jgi:hypothetical protein